MSPREKSSTLRPARLEAAAAASKPAYVDAVEAGVARVLLEDPSGEWRAYSLPASILPEGAGEGSWLDLTLKLRKPPKDAQSATLRQRLGKKDDGGDIHL
jgi:hypothetical protein